MDFSAIPDRCGGENWLRWKQMRTPYRGDFPIVGILYEEFSAAVFVSFKASYHPY